jgi:hypothetical protein
MAASLVLVLTAGIVYAAPVTQSISYQGKLTDAAGTPLTGPYTVTFKLYDVASGGPALATDTHSVTATSGLFTTTIATNPAVVDGRALWLGIKVGSDAEMTPRQALQPVPYAMSLRPGAVINGDIPADAIVHLINTGTGSAALLADTTGDASIAVYGVAHGPLGNGVMGESDQDAGIYGIGKEGGYFTTNSAGTSWNDVRPGVNVSTSYAYNPGVRIDTSGLHSNGVETDTTGSGSYGVSAYTTGANSDGVRSLTAGSGSHGFKAVTYGKASRGVDTVTTGDNSPGVYAYTTGANSPAVWGNSTQDVGVYGKGKEGGYFTTNQGGTSWSDIHAGVNVSTSYYYTDGVQINTSGGWSNGVSAVTTGAESIGVRVHTLGGSSIGVLAATSGDYSDGIAASTSGKNSNAVHVDASGPYSDGVSAEASGIGSNAVRGYSMYGQGILGESTYIGVHGISEKEVPGTSYKGSVGVLGESFDHVGVSGESIYSVGVHGQSSSKEGVWGESIYSAGVHGQSTNKEGVWGNSTNNIGVKGSSTNKEGVWGNSTNNIGVKGSSTNGNGLYGQSTNKEAIYGFSVNDIGIHGATSYGSAGVKGDSYLNEGLYGESFFSAGVHGNSTYKAGVWGVSENDAGVYAVTNRADHKYGIYTPDYLFTKGTQVPAADVAEYMQVAENVTPGTVLVIGKGGVLRPSVTAYDTHVAGIVSTQPGVSLGTKEGGNPGEAQIAVAGKVPCNVDASNGAIEEGDLLTTSDTPGYAMKAEPTMINGRGFYPDGTILGKAMGTLESGTGTIEVLVTLQ